VRILGHVVVKFGIGVTKDEAENQKGVYKVVDHGIVRIPRVYRVFTDERGRGYIVMEYIEGRVSYPKPRWRAYSFCESPVRGSRKTWW